MPRMPRLRKSCGMPMAVSMASLTNSTPGVSRSFQLSARFLPVTCRKDAWIKDILW